MDDTANAVAPAIDTSAASTNDAAPASSPGADASQASPTESNDIFGGQDFDSMFGLEPESGTDNDSANGPATPADDVKTAADTPAPHQGQEDVTTKTAEGEAPADPAAGTQTDNANEATAHKFNDKLNWDDEKAPKQFREEFKALKEEYQRVLDPANNWENAYLTGTPDEFVKRLAETSPTVYQEVGTLIATQSAQANPQGWIDYLTKSNPDELAKAITGRDITADRLRAELSVLDADDESDIAAAMDKTTTAVDAAKPAEETPQQKQLNEFIAEREQQKQQAARQEVIGPIESAINALVSDAGLEIKDDVWKADFNSLDEDTRFKRTINNMIPVYIAMRSQMDPKSVHLENRLQQFLEKGDTAGAKKLQYQAQIYATNFAGEFLSMVTGYRAKSKQADLTPPALEAPKVHVPTGGQSTSAIAPAPSANGNGSDMWKVTEQDLYGK